jgi:hypothetical protein
MNPTSTNADFDQHYQTHLKHLKRKGLQPKTIDAYTRILDQHNLPLLKTWWVNYGEHRWVNFSERQR